VFGIHDILIRILGSVFWITNPDSSLFCSKFKDANKIEVILLISSCTVGTLTSVLKDNVSLRSHRTVEINGLILMFLLVDGSIRIRILEAPKSYGSGRLVVIPAVYNPGEGRSVT
jgi:hypothetical protein